MTWALFPERPLQGGFYVSDCVTLILRDVLVLRSSETYFVNLDAV